MVLNVVGSNPTGYPSKSLKSSDFKDFFVPYPVFGGIGNVDILASTENGTAQVVISSEAEKSAWFSWQISPLPPVGRNDRKGFRSVEMTIKSRPECVTMGGVFRAALRTSGPEGIKKEDVPWI